MEEIEAKINEIYKKAQRYMQSDSVVLNRFGSGMMFAASEIQDILIDNKEYKSVLQKIEKEVITHMGHEGNKIDMELHYDGRLFCKPISDGDRTNNYYFKKVILYMSNNGYDYKKFNIKVGGELYIQ